MNSIVFKLRYRTCAVRTCCCADMRRVRWEAIWRGDAPQRSTRPLASPTQSTNTRHARHDRTELVHSWRMEDRFPVVLGFPWELERLGSAERHRESWLARRMRVHALQSSFFGRLGLGIFAGLASGGRNCRSVSSCKTSRPLHAPAAFPFVVFMVAMSDE